MKQWLLFAGSEYYPSGGWDDFIGDFDTYKEAEAKLIEIKVDWWQIVDSMGPLIVEGPQ